MNPIRQRKYATVLFDESHSESWTISRARAIEIDPHRPDYSSYQTAADALTERDFTTLRNTNQPLHGDLLRSANVLVLLHPCDARWERTTSPNPPTFSPTEIADILDFVAKGGGLFVVTEYEHDKYGDNLNEMLANFGLHIENTTVIDRSACIHENPAWFFANVRTDHEPLLHGVDRVCFYQGGSCTATNRARIVLRASEKASPQEAGLIGITHHGLGRVVLITDSVLFGDERIHEFDHRQLWLNLVQWCAVPALQKISVDYEPTEAAQSPEWAALKQTVNLLRTLQSKDGSVELANHPQAGKLVQTIQSSVQGLNRMFPHQTNYLANVVAELTTWVHDGFQKPDFGKSLASFNPQQHRRDKLETLVVFPMYTPNHSLETRFEALLFRTPWPEWLAEMERRYYSNEKFVPGHLIDYTDGYESECAVLFPETVSLRERPTNNFATIFCDREARRLQRCVLKTVPIVRLELHPQLEGFFHSLALIQDTYALWDLIHDKTHSLGELPFDPFMIRQKSPFWMYGLEELRVDLRAFCEAIRLVREGFPFTEYVTYAILFDRIFRFPITGSRVRNYDGLGGQLLFAYLHQKDVVLWVDNQLSVRWDLLADSVNALREEIVALYKLGSDCSKMSFWLAAHDLVSQYVRPNVASVWKRDSRAITDESDPKKWIALVHDDEFPLGNFHVNLQRKLADF